MDDFSQTHFGSGDNVKGSKHITYLSSDMDVGRLSEILQSEGEKIKDLFAHVEAKNAELEIDDRTIAIDRKNQINGLADFYEKFIKEHEGKLLALDEFFKENDYMAKIESAAYNLRMHIFSRQNRTTSKLDAATLDDLIQNHTKAIRDAGDKDVMILLMFYLYRFCYIGDKNGS